MENNTKHSYTLHSAYRTKPGRPSRCSLNSTWLPASISLRVSSVWIWYLLFPCVVYAVVLILCVCSWTLHRVVLCFSGVCTLMLHVLYMSYRACFSCSTLLLSFQDLYLVLSLWLANSMAVHGQCVPTV